MQVFAAVMSLGDMGPALTVIECKDGQIASWHLDFDEDHEAESVWGELGLPMLYYDGETALFVGEPPTSCMVSVDGKMGGITLHYGLESVSAIGSASWMVTVAAKILPMVPRKSQESNEQIKYASGTAVVVTAPPK